MKLTDHERSVIAKAADDVTPGDLYRMLHLVGDDTVKAEIEDALEGLLDRETFKKVVAVFVIAATDKYEADLFDPEREAALEAEAALGDKDED